MLTLPYSPQVLPVIVQQLETDPRLVSPHTRANYGGDLARFEAWRAGRALSRLLVEEYATSLRAAGLAPASINRALSAIRWWTRRAGELAYSQPLERQQREEIVLQAARVATVRNIKGTRLPKGRHLTNGEVRRLLAACSDGSVQGARDAALIGLAWATGARQAELAGLLVTDVALDLANEEGLVTIRHGKGDKARQVAFLHGAYTALVAWLDLRGAEDGFLFCPGKRGGQLAPERRLSHEALRQILIRRAAGAQLEQRCTWHDFRRTFIGNLLDAGVDLAVAQRLAGHSDPKITSGYDRRDTQVQRAAVRSLHLPFEGK